MHLSKTHHITSDLDFIGSFSLPNGAVLVIPEGAAGPYASEKAQQLQGVLEAIAKGRKVMSETALDALTSLAMALSYEVAALIPIVEDDEMKNARVEVQISRFSNG